MKKELLFAASAAMVFLSACSNEENLPEATGNDGVQEIVLQVANTGDGMTTRAGRELLSDEAGQEIDNVVLVIVGQDGFIKYKYDTNNWKGESQDYDHGRYHKIRLEGEKRLAKGTYTVYAYGYSNGSNYNVTEKLESFEEGKQFTTNIELTGTAEEIFAGSLILEVPENKTFDKEVILNRQVAGAYFYVENLPVPTVGELNADCYLQLVAVDYNNILVLGRFNSKDFQTNGNNKDDAAYVVNGYKTGAAQETVVCEARLGDWYSAFTDDDENGIIDIKNWISTADAKAKGGVGRKGAKYVKGSVFAANFLIPFKSIAEKRTLWLRIVDKKNTENNEALSSIRWNINLPADDVYPSLTYFDPNTTGKWATLNESGESVSTYSIVRNHLYSIGAKTTDGKPTPPAPGEDPVDPEDPDPEDPTPDDPQDLSKVQDLTLRVNHNWEVIHRMVID